MKKRILIVDDDPDISEAMRLVLDDEGYHVLTLDDHVALISTIYSMRPALVFLDILLSGKDGRDLCKILKSDPQTSNIPVVIVSALSTAQEDIANYLADDFLLKPFSMEDLVRLTRRYVVDS